MGQAKACFNLKSNLAELDKLCLNVRRFCESIGLSSKDLFQITLVIDELFTNIVSYGFKDSEDKNNHAVCIELSLNRNILEIRIEDDGIAFNPLKLAQPDLQCPLEEREIGGLGVLLVKKLMDEVQYQRHDNKNVIILKRHLT
jgi:anti-sigma regulatory factor (Ser/Thr protein kinase)